MKICFKTMLFGLFLALFAPKTTAQTEGPPLRPFDESSFRSATQGIDYSGDQIKKEPPKSSKPKQQSPQFGWGIDWGKWGKALQWLVIALAIVGVAILALQIVDGPRSKKLAQPLEAVGIDGLEARLREADFERLSDEAAAEGRFDLAVRLRFLAVLKSLDERGLIVHQREKTDRDYLRELSESPFRAEFRAVALLFERIWYGEATVSKADHDGSIRPLFDSFLKKIAATAPVRTDRTV